jgi:NADPH-dependent glutamate synthase beta subunit-like oxidoreductase
MTLEVYERSKGQRLIEDLYQSFENRLAVCASSTCPVEFTGSFVKMAAAQSCGKCTPCRVGLAQLANCIDTVLDGTATLATLDLIQELAEGIYYSADCAIGSEAATLALKAIKGFADDFRYHVAHHDCGAEKFAAVPCVAGCPAGVDIPGYIALTAAGRYDDAIMLVRKDNPFAVACGLVCEHPCELHCRRGMVDDALNIRGIKRYAADHQKANHTPQKAAATGKRVAVVGGGPAGLTAAYYLALMGHTPVVFEQGEKLGGMLRYGIPAYRLPHETLDAEIAWLLAQGIEVRTGVSVGAAVNDLSLEQLINDFDALYVAIGAHSENRLGIDGEDASGVISAVQLLRGVGDGEHPDFAGKRVIVVGGGNVAADVARTALRLGAQEVKITYRRRKVDMPAQPAEVEAAIAEGCEIYDLQVPVRVATKDGVVTGLVVQPQIIGEIVDGRAKPAPAKAPEVTLDGDLIIAAIGQSIDSAHFEQAGIAVKRGRIVADKDASVAGVSGVFSGGDCVTGPSTVIMAVAAGKAAAKNIDAYLGYEHSIEVNIDIPTAFFKGRMYCARSNMSEAVPEHIAGNFDVVETGFLPEELALEASRCLRCDHFGIGAFRDGRSHAW